MVYNENKQQEKVPSKILFVPFISTVSSPTSRDISIVEFVYRYTIKHFVRCSFLVPQRIWHLEMPRQPSNTSAELLPPPSTNDIRFKIVWKIWWGVKWVYWEAICQQSNINVSWSPSMCRSVSDNRRVCISIYCHSTCDANLTRINIAEMGCFSNVARRGWGIQIFWNSCWDF